MSTFWSPRRSSRSSLTIGFGKLTFPVVDLAGAARKCVALPAGPIGWLVMRLLKTRSNGLQDRALGRWPSAALRSFAGVQVLPVLDLLGGQVVHAVAGERSRYRPLAQPWIGTSDPVGVARALQAEFGVVEFYVADLDGILGQPIQWPIIAALQQVGYQLWLDVGWQTVGQLEQSLPPSLRSVPSARGGGALESAAAGANLSPRSAEPALPLRWVLGSESLASGPEMQQIARTLGPERCTLSLDLREGQVQLGPGWRPQTDVSELAACAREAGIHRLLVLELSRVGTDRGLAPLELCQELRRQVPVGELWWGGGVRGPADLERLAQVGIDRVLVGTALFTRQLRREDMELQREDMELR